MRRLPEAIEMEKKVLSAMMLRDGEAIPTVEGMLKPSDFYREEHRCIYRALMAVYSRRTPPDVLLIEEELRSTGELEKVRREYLFSLIDYEFTTARVESYAKAIREKALLRQLRETCDELMEESFEEKKPVAEILEAAGKRIFGLGTKLNTTAIGKAGETINKTFEEIIERAQNPGEVTGVRTKLLGLDRALNGLQKSDLILLAARPSMGKTALALNIATNAASSGTRVALFSLEMSKGQLAERLLSMASGVNSFKLKTGNLADEDMQALIGALEKLNDLTLYIDDTAGITMLELRSKVRRLSHEEGLDLIVIDYLQLMQGVRAENRQQEISEISRSLKALAREMDIPILALSQLSRGVEMRADKKPQLSDLRESGSLEQDADVVMFLYRDEYYNRDEENNQNIAELIIAKNRNGPTTSIALQFNKEIMRFGDLTRAAE